eukprot:7349432-Ditylum_brightwellii.AAC.1
MLAQIQAGLPINAARCSLCPLNQLEYYMVTSYGVSDTGVNHMEKQPVYGLGQGATDAPPNWTLLTNICQKAYAKHSKGCRILNTTGTIQLDAQGKFFVDDKSLMHNDKKPNPSATKLMEIVTHDLSLWDRYI